MSFVATPPSPQWPTVLGSWTFTRKIVRYFWQPLVPFAVAAIPPDDFPTEALGEKEEEHCVAFCQEIFDAAEERRGQLEQKAQWTFAAIGLVTPSLASIFVFALHEPTFTPGERAIPIILLAFSATVMLLSYVSAARALWVRGREILFLGAVIDLTSGAFKPYDAAERARGFLYCASMNTAYNDHIAQFVRGAQVLAAVSIILFSAGAVSTTFHSGQTTISPVRVDVIHLPQADTLDLDPIHDALVHLTEAIDAEQHGNADIAIEGLISRVDALEAARSHVQTSPLPSAYIHKALVLRHRKGHHIKPHRDKSKSHAVNTSGSR